MSERVLDVVVLGGGIMGSTTALHLAEAGMRVAVLDRRGLCSSASGVNAGTLSLLNKRVGLIPYALRSLDLWETMAERSESIRTLTASPTQRPAASRRLRPLTL